MGLDISHHNGHCDFGRIKAAGHSFVFIKATEGTHVVDPMFADNWARAGQAGLIRGPYHFMRSGDGAVEQARNFLTAIHSVGGLADTDLPPVMDFEDRDNVPRHCPWEIAVAEACKFMDIIQEMRGREPIIYIDRDMANMDAHVDSLKLFGKYHLWLAEYNRDGQPHVPRQWSDWAFHQWTDRGTCDGAGGAGTVDLDTFRFGFKGLASWVQSTIKGSAVWPLPNPLG